MLREDTYSVSVMVDAVDLGVWDMKNGGEGDSEETTYKPGGMGAQISLGGSQTTGNVTVAKLYDKAIHDRVHWLMGRRGRATMIVTQQPLDADGAAWGRPIVYSGTLKRVSPPDHDSESNSAAKIELEMTPNGPVA